jgi:hypothetical protein
MALKPSRGTWQYGAEAYTPKTAARACRGAAPTIPILPDKGTWYPATNLPHPGGPYDVAEAAHGPADLTEVVRLYRTRHWKTNSAGPTPDPSYDDSPEGATHQSCGRIPELAPSAPRRPRVAPATPLRAGLH